MISHDIIPEAQNLAKSILKIKYNFIQLTSIQILTILRQ